MNGAKTDASVSLSDDVVRNFRVTKTFQESSYSINHIDFSPSGDKLISSALDDKIVVYDCEKGIRKSALFSKKYGVDLVHFTHAENAIIHCSTKIDDTIRYLSLHDNKYIRYFVGHTKRVNTLCMSPSNDTFLTTSLDETLRLWDLRSPHCHATMNCSGEPLGAYDPEGIIFAAGINSQSIKLFDVRSYSHGPFLHFMLPRDNIKWSSMKFSPNGKSIMINTYGSLIRLVDAYSGEPIGSFSGHFNINNLPLEASFSPDSQFICSGSSDGQIHVWNTNNGYKICNLESRHPGFVGCMKFNPKYLMLATACNTMAFWIPQLDDF